MKDVILVRHAQAEANVRNFTAFENNDSPLTEKGRTTQIEDLRLKLAVRGIEPLSYERRVRASTFRRTGETAVCVGFAADLIDRGTEIDESDVSREVLSGRDVILKHSTEGWVPEETKARAERFIELVHDGNLDYDIFFTHGLFIASVLTVLDGHGFEFDSKRGYIPLQASITSLTI